MRVLVTGGGGFAGQHLVRRLSDAGQSVVSAGHNADISMDFRIFEQVVEVVETVRPDIAYHLAGTSSVAELARDPLGGNQNVVKPALHLMEVLAQKAPECRMLLVSTCQVYGRPPRLPIDEGCPMAPVDLYGSARAAVEYMVSGYRARGLDVRIARAFHHTGPGQDRRFALGDWAARVAAGERQIPVGNLQLRRDYSDVRDVVAGYQLIAEEGERSGLYNLCSGEAQTMGSLFRLLCGEGVEPVEKPERLRTGEAPVLLGSPEKAESLGWKRRYTLEETFRDMRNATQRLPAY